jgi:hypothetical protein
VQNIVRAIKRRATDHPNAPPSSLFREEIARVDNEEVWANLPQRNDVIRNINRIKNKQRPTNPHTLENLSIIEPFFQLYTIYGTCMNYTFPLIHCWATRKNETFYRRLLNRLILHAQELNLLFNPQFIISEFELAFINATKDVFPNSTINGCLLHFTLAIWKHTVLKGLKQSYNEMNEVVRNTIQKFLGLPFVPVEDIFECVSW